MNEESDRMMVLLQELATLKQNGRENCGQDLVSRRRRREISEEMKRLAAEKKKGSQ